MKKRTRERAKASNSATLELTIGGYIVIEDNAILRAEETDDESIIIEDHIILRNESP